MSALKLQKAAGHDGITGEHDLVVHMCLLFNSMLRHSFVPSDFRFGLIKPVLKDKHGDITSTDMYRPITVTPVMSKLFELVLLQLYGDFLTSDNLQFGFKKETGCSHALFTLTESVKHFANNGSKVHCAFLDASKAFDKVLLNGLYLKLIQRGAPLSFIRILITLYTDLQCAVVWNGSIGYRFDVKCGVRQGGVLSPYLFSIYVDDLIKELRHSGHDIHVNMVFVTVRRLLNSTIEIGRSAVVRTLPMTSPACQNCDNGCATAPVPSSQKSSCSALFCLPSEMLWAAS